MAIDFPNSPSNGQTVVVGGITYTFNSSKGVWADSATGLPVTISDTPPTNPAAGNIWYDSSDPALYIYYNDGSSAQWVSANPNNRTTNNAIALTDFSVTSATPSGNGALSYDNSTGVFNFTPADTASSSGVTTYSALSDLPMSGQDNGALAFVSGTNRLYIWNNSGWYNIALINTNPTISGASATYDLNTDGSNTVVTLVATDPEGLPISFTATHSGIGVGANAIATVTQSNNIFTYTPTTNTSLGGTFTTTFTASDGVNIAGANSSFTLSFNLTISNSKYTTALITSVGGNNADNNDFVDSSTNSHTVTGYNGAQNTTFSPFRSGGYSTYFDGTGDYLTLPSHSSFNFTGEFCIEFWYYGKVVQDGVVFQTDGSNAAGWGIGIWSSNFKVYRGGFTVTNTTTISAGQWYHVRLNRDSNNDLRIFVNGVSGSTYTDSTTNASYSNPRIGNNGSYAPESVNGYISDLRVVNGSSIGTSNFTVPTERLTAITNTSLLTCHLPYIADGSTNSHTITVNGDTKTEPFAPYDYTEYSASDDSSSMRFDQTSSNDYVLVANDNSAMDLGSAFTLECWFYTENRNQDVAIMQRGGGGGSAWNGTDGIYYGISFYNSKIAWISQPSGGSNQYMTCTTDVPLNRWNHVAVSYNGTTTSVYLNGVREATSTQTYNTPSSRGVFAVGTGTVGGAASSTNDYTGNIAEFRLSNSVRYDPSQTTLTMPTAPFTSDSDTGVLLKGGNAGIIDKSQSAKTLTLTGDVKSSTAQTKNSTTSIQFDGTGDKIEIPDFQLLRDGRDYTIEFWIYLTNTSAERNILETFSFGATTGWTIYHLTGGRLDFYPSHTNMTTLSATTWTHIAIENYGGTIKCFVNGTSTYSATHVTTSTPTTGLRIGTRSGTTKYLNGYVEDIRITDGYARYQGTNFTPPSAALDG